MSSEAPNTEFPSDARLVEVSGVSLELIVKGSGRPLLFLHGMDGVEKASGLIDRLARDFTVYAPSHPGFGASSLPGNFSTVDDLAYFYLDLLDHLGLRDVLVAGFSFGGWVAAEILVKDSSRVSALVLGAPFGLRTGERREQLVTDIFMLSPRDVQARMQVTPQDEADPASLSDALLERAARNAEAVSLFGWSPYLHNPKLAQRLHRIRVPVLMLWGDSDQIAPISYGRQFAAQLPSASFEILPQCGHRIYADCPSDVAARIADFGQASETAAAAA